MSLSRRGELQESIEEILSLALPSLFQLLHTGIMLDRLHQSDQDISNGKI